MKKNTHYFYRALCLIFACFILTSGFSQTASASEITPYYVKVTSTIMDLTISSSGKADILAAVTASYPTDRIVGTVSLMQFTDDGWQSIKDWSLDNNGEITLDTIRYVSKGYLYQLTSSFDVYDKYGTYCETVTPSSKIVSYL